MTNARRSRGGRSCEGLGTAIALPWLEAMAPAAGAGRAAPAPAAGRARRMAFLYVPNGVHMADWTPKAEGTGLHAALRSSSRSQPFKDDLLVLTGLTQDNGRPTATAAATTPGRSPAS